MYFNLRDSLVELELDVNMETDPPLWQLDGHVSLFLTEFTLNE